ncbi:MAG: site-specific integrase [Paludibacteraceae bacterium]|nr:site-specific integrase [Paludibacteraceae bacterium]
MSVFKIPSTPLHRSENVPTFGSAPSLQSYVNFYPAVLKFCPNPSLGWYIEYYARTSKTQRLSRYRIRLNIVKRRYRKMSEFYEYANTLVLELNMSLSQGWTPDQHSDGVQAGATSQVLVPSTMLTTPMTNAPTAFDPTATSAQQVYHTTIMELQREVKLLKVIVAQYTQSAVIPQESLAKPMQEISNEQEKSAEVEIVPAVCATPTEPKSNGILLVDLLDRFVEAKEKVVRKDTFRAYSNFAHTFKKYLLENMPDIAAQDFTRADAQAYMAYREEEMMKFKRQHSDFSDKSTRSINNYIKSHRLFFSWGIEEELITNNPFAQLKLQRNEEKRRDLVPENALKQVKDYLVEHDQKGFLLVCMLIYSGFIRPKEIRELRVRDIHMKDHCIIVPPEVSKNHCSRIVGITPEIENLMHDLRLDILPEDYFICGKDLTPSKMSAPDASYRKAWLEMRRELNFPETMQLYSLKDSGITTMLENGVPAIDVMKQAGHHDLAMTTRYASHKDTRIAQKMYNNNLSFGSQKE